MKFKFKYEQVVFLEKEPYKSFVIFKKIKENNNNFYLLKTCEFKNVTFKIIKSFHFKLLTKYFGWHRTFKFYKKILNKKIINNEVYNPPLYVTYRTDNLVPEFLIKPREVYPIISQCSDEDTCTIIQNFLNEA